ncbi:MAG: hypothetical protein U0931_29320 [Vulcanimicrobiota bacterium]
MDITASSRAHVGSTFKPAPGTTDRQPNTGPVDRMESSPPELQMLSLDRRMRLALPAAVSAEKPVNYGAAMKEAHEQMGKPIDVISHDSCLMGEMEWAYQLSSVEAGCKTRA